MRRQDVEDVLRAFAGGQSLAETDEATFERMFEVNFRSAFYLAKATLPGMRARGSGSFLAIGITTASLDWTKR